LLLHAPRLRGRDELPERVDDDLGPREAETAREASVLARRSSGRRTETTTRRGRAGGRVREGGPGVVGERMTTGQTRRGRPVLRARVTDLRRRRRRSAALRLGWERDPSEP
jgi:hypothetical protein